MSSAEPIDSGRLETKIATSSATPTRSRRQVDPQHQLLGDPVEEGAERQRGAALDGRTRRSIRLVVSPK